MPNDSELIYEFGPKDETGLQHYLLYCRRCHKISDFIPPGCLSILFLQVKHTANGVMDPKEIYANAQQQGVYQVFPDRIAQALRADGII
jgi:hypothetical protein